MESSLYGRPFTQRIQQLRRGGMRYVDLEHGCRRARSTAWFNNLCTSSNPWRVGPPTADAIDALAVLLDTIPQHVREMIAEEWYGVRLTKTSTRVRQLAQRLDALSDEDAALIEGLVQRLQPPDEPRGSIDDVA